MHCMMAADSRSLETWIKVWLFMSALICTWDAGFVLLRPKTLPGGSLHTFWKPYAAYIEIDKAYADLNNSNMTAMCLMNMVEVVLTITTLVLDLRKNRESVPLAFTVTTMMFWKTVYFLLPYTDMCGGSDRLAHVRDRARVVFLFWVPNEIWIIMPFLVIVRLWRRVRPEEALSQDTATKKFD